MILTEVIYDLLVGDATLAALINTYEGSPAVFTTDPAPPDAQLPYIVAASVPVNNPFDTKTTLGRTIWRDIRIYGDNREGTALFVDNIAERVRTLLHRQPLTIPGYNWIMTDCMGPITADENMTYGRIITAKITVEQSS